MGQDSICYVVCSCCVFSVVESYMHVFGSDLELSEFHYPVETTNSRQYYLHMQEQIQLELFYNSAMLAEEGACLHLPQPTSLQMQRYLMPDEDTEILISHQPEDDAANPDAGPDGGDVPAGGVWSGDEGGGVCMENTEDNEGELNPLNMADVRCLLIRDERTDEKSDVSGDIGSKRGAAPSFSDNKVSPALSIPVSVFIYHTD